MAVNPAVERLIYQLPSIGRKTDRSVLPSPSKSALGLDRSVNRTGIVIGFKSYFPSARGRTAVAAGIVNYPNFHRRSSSHRSFRRPKRMFPLPPERHLYRVLPVPERQTDRLRPCYTAEIARYPLRCRRLCRRTVSETDV